MVKTKLEISHINFSSSDFSVDISLIFKSLGNVPNNPPQECISQNYDISPGSFFVLCRHFNKLFFHYYLRFVL